MANKETSSDTPTGFKSSIMACNSGEQSPPSFNGYFLFLDFFFDTISVSSVPMYTQHALISATIYKAT